MNAWVILIILLIPLGVWVLSTIFKGDEADKTTQNRSDSRPGIRRPRRPPPPVVRPEPVRRRDMPEGMESRQDAPRRQPPVPRPGGQRRAAPILATIIEEPPPVVRKPTMPEPPPVLLPLSIPQLAPSLPPAPAAPTRPEKGVSPVLQEVRRCCARRKRLPWPS